MHGSRTSEDVIALGRVRALAATLDLEPGGLHDGAPLPLGWHWIFFHDPARRSDLGPDGHERTGGFLPDLGLPRRMWAGGRLRFRRPLRVGEGARRVSTVGTVERKEGRSGPLAFVTVRHLLHGADGNVAVEEEQDLVYLEARKPSDGAGASDGGHEAGASDGGHESGASDGGHEAGASDGGHEAAAPDGGHEAAAPDGAGDGAAGERSEWRETFVANEVTLFRFSALTFNAHRIHYDRRYATEVESYPDLVVHGPLLALLVLGAGLRHAGSAEGVEARFEYRAAQPLFCNEEIVLAGEGIRHAGGAVHVPGGAHEAGSGRGHDPDARQVMALRAEHRDRGVAMRATLERYG
jgi:3-methylfumaryl-CoA hydratase